MTRTRRRSKGAATEEVRLGRGAASHARTRKGRGHQLQRTRVLRQAAALRRVVTLPPPRAVSPPRIRVASLREGVTDPPNLTKKVFQPGFLSPCGAENIRKS